MATNTQSAACVMNCISIAITRQTLFNIFITSTKKKLKLLLSPILEKNVKKIPGSPVDLLQQQMSKNMIKTQLGHMRSMTN